MPWPGHRPWTLRSPGWFSSGYWWPAGRPAVCLEWSTARALAAGATEDEIADVLLAIAPVTGLGRVVGAAPDVAAALGYDVGAALEQLDDP